MQKYVIEGLSRIKVLDGVIHDGNFRYLETFKTKNSQGSFRRYYNAGDYFESKSDALAELVKRRIERIEELENTISVLRSADTVDIFNKEESLNYANSYLKDESGFTYTVEV